MSVRFGVLRLLAGALLLAGCDPTIPPPPETRIIVYTHQSGVPVAGVRAEVLDPPLAGVTGADGTLSFIVEPGEYTVRVFTSRLHPPYFDHHVNVQCGDHALIDSDYCWTCEGSSPTPAGNATDQTALRR